MKLTSVQQSMLYALGTCYSELKKRFKEKPYDMAMSKIDFIDLLHNARVISKKDRAAYKNLEALEKLKLIVYDNKVLNLTKKGELEYEKILKSITPYIKITGALNSDDILKYAAHSQTVLR